MFFLALGYYFTVSIASVNGTLKANVLAIRGVSFDPFRPITFEQGEGEAREG